MQHLLSLDKDDARARLEELSTGLRAVFAEGGL
jgi:hypothetical protein